MLRDWGLEITTFGASTGSSGTGWSATGDEKHLFVEQLVASVQTFSEASGCDTSDANTMTHLVGRVELLCQCREVRRQEHVVVFLRIKRAGPKISS